ncbi:gallate dioxygenase [Robbsia sp. Bb-Pol-6]|uniref:Gallate dioxygenase n=1 Tax=Robbsia betulipollinis TaxID=2981849 RepID=A0ABT3ZUP9_9BURK|nr:gallate dioxygenase [Robbsia betulipollinis]MCY0389568.1 gallate dioxygenase [Robbsia betulipollinis]
MARIIGGIGTSHVPTMGLAHDKGKHNDPAWAPLFQGYAPVAQWLAERKPDVMLMIYNDHANSFFFDCYPTFALGVSGTHEFADEGAGKRNLPDISGHSELAVHLAEQLIADEFDLTIFQDRPLDHGCNSPLSLMSEYQGGWPFALVPLQVNVLQYPLPTANRCYRLGQALRRAIESFDADLNVVVVGTGGLSHQVHGERSGFNNEDWDKTFLEWIVTDPERLARMKHVDYIRLGGAESVETIMWLTMRGALGASVQEVHRNYYLATSTAMAVTVYETAPAESAP